MPVRSSIARATPAELVAARDYNAKQWAKDQKRKSFSANDYYFIGGTARRPYLIKPGETGPDASSGKGADIMAGAITGVLPFYTINGDDGLLVADDGSTKRVELKLGGKRMGRYSIGPNGGLVGGDGGKKRPNVRNDFKAYYEIVNNLMKKNVETYLVLLDLDTWEVIEIVGLDGKNVVNLLKYDQSTGKLKTSKKRSITLANFLQSGWKVRPHGVDVVGIDEWEDRIYAKFGKTRAEASVSTKWTPELDEQLLQLHASGMSYKDIAKTMNTTKSSVSNRIPRARTARAAA